MLLVPVGMSAAEAAEAAAASDFDEGGEGASQVETDFSDARPRAFEVAVGPGGLVELPLPRLATGSTPWSSPLRARARRRAVGAVAPGRPSSGRLRLGRPGRAPPEEIRRGARGARPRLAVATRPSTSRPSSRPTGRHALTVPAGTTDDRRGAGAAVGSPALRGSPHRRARRHDPLVQPPAAASPPCDRSTPTSGQVLRPPRVAGSVVLGPEAANSATPSRGLQVPAPARSQGRGRAAGDRAHDAASITSTRCCRRAPAGG